jgi:seryl-tRNA synthetase
MREWGTKREFKFTPQAHWDLGQKLDIIDLPASARISGSGFHMLKGPGAKLQRALINYMLDLHASDGFLELTAPHLVTEDSLRGTGQLPKMAEDMYKTTEDNLYLIPTAEVPVTNMYKGEIIDGGLLPMKFVAHTPCYRREAGAAGKDTRGILRLHQFDKVEMVLIVEPEHSYDALEMLTAQAEKVIQGLKLPYRVAMLASGDLSFAAAKCYDLELWSPGVGSWLEVSSVSNFEEFQARRMNLRYRDADKKVTFPHTLNGSGTALPRLVIAVMENYQNEDGSISVPEILRPYMGGIEKIS